MYHTLQTADGLTCPPGTQFDDLSAPELGFTRGEIPSPYNGLSFNYQVQQAGPTNQVPAESFPNWAEYGLNTQTATGQAAGFTAKSPNSKTLGFDLISFYVACIADTAFSTGQAVGCTVRLKCIDASTGAAVPEQLITYEPATLLNNGDLGLSAAMKFVQPGSHFKRLESCTQEILAGSTDLSSVIGAFDEMNPPVSIRLDDLVLKIFYSR